MHLLRYSFAITFWRTGTTPEQFQDLLEHSDVKTTMIYTHVLQGNGGRGVRNPLDATTLRDTRERIGGGRETSVTTTHVDSRSSKAESAGIAWEYAGDE